MSKIEELQKSVGTTLGRFIKERQSTFAYATGELSQILRDLAYAAKIVHREVNRAGLAGITGSMQQTNIQGEEQQKLDVMANTHFKRAMKNGGEIAAIISEEEAKWVDLNNSTGKYLLAIDPLDGSSNIDVNVSIGTIFSIYKRKERNRQVQEADFLQKGVLQILAGYILYGSSTMLVYSTGQGVHGFTYDVSLGEFFLSHPLMSMPEEGRIYSINEGLYHSCTPSMQYYMDSCRAKKLIGRYIGSLVADFHRNLLKGGIYAYPSTKETPEGKLRLMYECNALALLAEQAGGVATDEKGNRVLEISPKNIHQRVPFFVGSKNMVKQALECLKATT